MYLKVDISMGYANYQARLPAPRAGGARFLLRAHYKHFCCKIIKSLERAGGAAAPPSVGVPANYGTLI